MEKDTKIYDLNKELSTIDTSTLTTLSTTNTSVLEILSDRISTVTNSASDDNWDDSVKTGISSAITSITGCINDVITSCNYIADAKPKIDNLKKLCNDYVTEYDSYEKMGPAPDMYLQEKDEEGNIKKVRNPEYASYMTRKNAFEDSLPKLAEEVHRVENAIKNYFKAIDLSTNTIDGSIYVEGSSDIQFDYSKYFDGRMEVEFEGWVDPPVVTETVNPVEHVDVEDESIAGANETQNQTIDRRSEGQYEIKYTDGSEVDANRTQTETYEDINNDGTIDDTDKLIYEKIHDDGTFTDANGNVYGYLHDEESDTIGLVSSSTTLTDQESGETVYNEEQERLGAYTDAFGIDYIEGEEEISQNGYTTHTRTVSYGNGTDSGEKTYSYTVKDDDPACGECINGDGDRIEYFRGEDDVLYERVNGGEPEVHEPAMATFTICDDTGKLIESIEVDAESELDILKIKSYLDDGNLACNYPSGQGSAMLGQLLLGDTAVYDAWTGKGFEYHIEYK